MEDASVVFNLESFSSDGFSMAAMGVPSVSARTFSAARPPLIQLAVVATFLDPTLFHFGITPNLFRRWGIRICTSAIPSGARTGR